MMVHLGCQECQVKWEQEGSQDQEALQAFLAHQEYREPRGDLDPKEMRDPLDPQGRRGYQETRAQLVLQVL